MGAWACCLEASTGSTPPSAVPSPPLLETPSGEPSPCTQGLPGPAYGSRPYVGPPSLESLFPQILDSQSGGLEEGKGRGPQPTCLFPLPPQPPARMKTKNKKNPTASWLIQSGSSWLDSCSRPRRRQAGSGPEHRTLPPPRHPGPACCTPSAHLTAGRAPRCTPASEPPPSPHGSPTSEAAAHRAEEGGPVTHHSKRGCPLTGPWELNGALSHKPSAGRALRPRASGTRSFSPRLPGGRASTRH